jgi:hypothetical protein
VIRKGTNLHDIIFYDSQYLLISGTVFLQSGI